MRKPEKVMVTYILSTLTITISYIALYYITCLAANSCHFCIETKVWMVYPWVTIVKCYLTHCGKLSLSYSISSQFRLSFISLNVKMTEITNSIWTDNHYVKVTHRHTHTHTHTYITGILVFNKLSTNGWYDNSVMWQ